MADEAVLTFLREKEKELGYEPYVGLFRDGIERINAIAHELGTPGA